MLVNNSSQIYLKFFALNQHVPLTFSFELILHKNRRLFCQVLAELGELVGQIRTCLFICLNDGSHVLETHDSFVFRLIVFYEVQFLVPVKTRLLELVAVIELNFPKLDTKVINWEDEPRESVEDLSYLKVE
jgi:hypothetical protein